ncbi:MAG: RluA family pseudouridine synthase [Chloroflexi bacterium]|nr:RluA family pseudouridine synthase [Chloroflexota bacterium]
MENERRIVLIVAEGGERIDKYVALRAPELTRTQVQKLIDADLITVNGMGVKSSQKVEPGDTILVRVPPHPPTTLAPEAFPLDVLYEDQDVIVINKPPGLTVHASPGHTSGTLVNALLAAYPELQTFGDNLRPGIVHRLDKDTSGVLLLARNRPVREFLQRQFRARSVQKVYTALVEGYPAPPDGLIDAPLGRHLQNRQVMTVLMRGGRPAQTRYYTVERFSVAARVALLEVQLLTGRTHQIRVHLSWLGYPVAGDRTYGSRQWRSSHPERWHLPLQRQFLHASRLTFRLPSTDQDITVIAPLAPDLATVLVALRAQEK